jgi:hypothetical protein
MIITLTRLYKSKGETVLTKAVAAGWITKEEKTKIMNEE